MPHEVVFVRPHCLATKWAIAHDFSGRFGHANGFHGVSYALEVRQSLERVAVFFVTKRRDGRGVRHNNHTSERKVNRHSIDPPELNEAAFVA